MSQQTVQALSPPKRRPTPASQGLPPLEPGDHLSRAEFERRCEAHPEIKKAELIEGVVYMPSPVRIEQHSRLHGDIVTWLGVYRAATPGLWLQPEALWSGDLAGLLATLQEGLASPEHAAFVSRLQGSMA